MNNKARLRWTLAWLFTLLTLAFVATGLAIVGLTLASPGETGPWGMSDTGGEPGYAEPFRGLATIAVSLPMILAVLGFGSVAPCLWRGTQRDAGTGPEGERDLRWSDRFLGTKLQPGWMVEATDNNFFAIVGALLAVAILSYCRSVRALKAHFLSPIAGFLGQLLVSQWPRLLVEVAGRTQTRGEFQVGVRGDERPTLAPESAV